MAEDGLDISIDGEEQVERSALAGLGDEDIRSSFYEGGLKSWECSVDLVRYLAGDEETWSDVRRVLEVYAIYPPTNTSWWWWWWWCGSLTYFTAGMRHLPSITIPISIDPLQTPPRRGLPTTPFYTHRL